MALDTAALVLFPFSAGVMTFFAPCAYPLLPGYIAYYLGRPVSPLADESRSNAESEGSGRWRSRSRLLIRAALTGLLVSCGFVLVYALVAGIVVTVGSRVVSKISVLELGTGVLLIVIGVAMLLGVRIPAPAVRLPARHRTASGFIGFGIVYGLAAAGCSAPIFVGLVLSVLPRPSDVLIVFGAYTAGMSVFMIGLTVLVALGRTTVLTVFSSRQRKLHLAAGCLLVGAGLIQVYLFLFRYRGRELLGSLFGI